MMVSPLSSSETISKTLLISNCKTLKHVTVAFTKNWITSERRKCVRIGIWVFHNRVYTIIKESEK